MAGGGDPQAVNEMVRMQIRSGRPARHWNRGVWIRFALAVTPTAVFAVLGYLQTH